MRSQRTTEKPVSLSRFKVTQIRHITTHNMQNNINIVLLTAKTGCETIKNKRCL